MNQLSSLPPGTFSPVLQALADALGANTVLAGEQLLDRHREDWSGTPSHEPVGMVLPRTPEDVATVLRICHLHGAPVVVQGGLTGLAGGANVQKGELVMSMARLDRIELLDAAGGTAIVQAGVTLQALKEAAEAHALDFPLDLGARGSCQLGGNAATNAGGNRVLRFGMMRNLILGLEVALPDGTLLTMLDRVIKNNAGYDLKQLFIGSEGTLGVVTRLSLALAPRPGWTGTALCAVDDFQAALALLRAAKARLPGLAAFELMWRDFFDAGTAAIHAAPPFAEPAPLYVLIESFAGSREQGEAAFEHMLEHALSEGLVQDAVIAQSQAQAEQLWAIREGVSELLSQCKPCAAFDVSVPIERMDALVQDLRTRLEASFPTQSHLFFGHLGDGNLHLISGPFESEQALVDAEAAVYAAVGRFHGSISAEHGIGVVKRPFLHHSRSSAELQLMRQLKGLLDPKGILNAGRIFESSTPAED
ncbi:FAD-binding protein [Variovorax guangxiensis]|uniref:FAD-binding protein n=1 Tax=Variovorax guangxiensis TaxID=1775474 RepID=A0A433MRM4_9BURK|nr:FAD-binding oxidoreductase [Variovorax guangxiensis]RUR70436.1 FAD-binding protein [Variovorax guangxiensis]